MSVSTEVCDTRTSSIQESRLVKVYSYKCRKRAKPPNAIPGILALILVLCSSTTVQGQSLLPKISLTEFNQTSIKDDVTFTLDQSPYLIIEDVIVHRTGIFCHRSNNRDFLRKLKGLVIFMSSYWIKYKFIESQT